MKRLKRKLIEWAVFALVAIGTIFLVRWFVPRVVQIGIATGILNPAPRRIDPALRWRLRNEQGRLAPATPAGPQGQSGSSPCLVLPVREGIGEKPLQRGSASPASRPNQPAGPFRACLNLIPGDSPAVIVVTSSVACPRSTDRMWFDSRKAFWRANGKWTEWQWRCAVSSIGLEPQGRQLATVLFLAWLLELFAWETEPGSAIHILNYTNPNTMRTFIRHFYPTGPLHVEVRVPDGKRVSAVRALRAGTSLNFEQTNDVVTTVVPSVSDDEVVALRY